MEIAVSSTGKDTNSDVADVFGRCPYFIIAEIKDKKIEKTEAIENKSINQTSGAGVSASQSVAERNVSAVITKNIGPRALDVLGQFDIEIYAGDGMIKDVLQDFMDGKLKKMDK